MAREDFNLNGPDAKQPLAREDLNLEGPNSKQSVAQKFPTSTLVSRTCHKEDLFFCLFPDLDATIKCILTSTHERDEDGHDARSVQKLRLLTR